MNTTETWIAEKILQYRKNPGETLSDMLISANDVIEQYLEGPSLTTKGVLEQCLKHHQLFLQELEKLDEETPSKKSPYKLPIEEFSQRYRFKSTQLLKCSIVELVHKGNLSREELIGVLEYLIKL